MLLKLSYALMSSAILFLPACSAEPDSSALVKGSVADADNSDRNANKELKEAKLQNPRETTSAPAPTVPERFRGLFALDRKACAKDYNYAPAFQNVTISADRVSFFETGGPVTDVNTASDSIAITLRETIGDGEFTRAIYLAVDPDGSVRYRSGQSQPLKTYVRCAAE